jgi:hypothetical protein
MTVLSFVNDRDALMQAATNRGSIAPDAGIILQGTSSTFHRHNDGSVDPATITVAAQLYGVTGPITFSVQGATLTNVTDKTADVAFSSLTGTTAVVTATAANAGSPKAQSIILGTAADGTVGQNGSRGAGQYFATGSTWSDIVASAAVPNSTPVNNDVVTISNGSTYALTKRYDGTNWIALGAVYDGSLFVTGSISASKIDSRGLTIKDNAGNIILGVGSSLSDSYVPPSAQNSQLTPAINAAATTATWSSVTGTGKPADNATRNTITSSTSAPTSPTDGDIWVDTNTPVTIKTRVAGAWVVGGKVPTALSHVDSTADTKLSGIAVGATANVVSQGVLASRPAGANGDFYYATDTTTLYQKVAGAWVAAANNYTNTNQLTDGAGLGQTATWSNVANRPADSAIFNSYLDPKIAAAGMTTFNQWKAWEFNSTLDGWTYLGMSPPTIGANSLTITSSGTDPILYSPTIALNGAAYDKVRMRVKRLNSTGIGWDGSLFWNNANHGDNGNYGLGIADTTVTGQWVILEWDITKATNYADWKNVTITKLRIDLGTTASDSFEIDWIAVGRYGVGSDELAAAAAAAATTASWPNVTGTGKPADNASADLKLVARGNASVVGNTATKTAGTANWTDADVYSVDSYTGGAYASAIATANNKSLMFGLNSDPTSDMSYSSLDYAWFLRSDNVLEIYEYNASKGSFGNYLAGDAFVVSYDGSKVRYLKNGVVIKETTVAITDRLYFDSAFQDVGASISNIRFGPMSSNNWSNVGGRPDDLQNLYVKSSFEDGLALPWQGGGGQALSVVSVSGQPFTKALQLIMRDHHDYANTFSVVPGETLYVEAWMDASTTSGNVAVGFRFDSADGVPLTWVGVGRSAGQGWARMAGKIDIAQTYTVNGTVYKPARAIPWCQIDLGSSFGTARVAGLRSSRFQSGATAGATLGVNVSGAVTNAKDIATNLGTFSSGGTARTEISDLGIRVYTGGALRIKIGAL